MHSKNKSFNVCDVTLMIKQQKYLVPLLLTPNENSSAKNAKVKRRNQMNKLFSFSFLSPVSFFSVSKRFEYFFRVYFFIRRMKRKYVGNVSEEKIKSDIVRHGKRCVCFSADGGDVKRHTGRMRPGKGLKVGVGLG